MEKIKIKTKEEARDFAIAWQHDFENQCHSYKDLAEWGEYFEKLAKKFHLVREFKENGII